MKVTGYTNILRAISMDDALSYVLTHPVSTAIVGALEVAHLEENAAIAKRFAPLADAKLRDIETRALTVGRDATFFRRGTWA